MSKDVCVSVSVSVSVSVCVYAWVIVCKFRACVWVSDEGLPSLMCNRADLRRFNVVYCMYTLRPRSHTRTQGVDWANLRTTTPPVVPELETAADTCYFPDVEVSAPVHLYGCECTCICYVCLLVYLLLVYLSCICVEASPSSRDTPDPYGRAHERVSGAHTTGPSHAASSRCGLVQCD